ncbi:hypothetical protein KFK09_022437 [Dendrobium nobile]|uniref:Uncharacterized protein n=1 Tax=Dendrobium nobile TaxID=94219 RepID=A0A8T3AJ37_DENNO|nr:hypothetical protein KFK09_022437 [Dendrobium nobile]
MTFISVHKDWRHFKYLFGSISHRMLRFINKYLKFCQDTTRGEKNVEDSQ